jgi:hypothetical protein
MYETSSEAQAELQGWIDDRTVLDYRLTYRTGTPEGLLTGEKFGLGTLSQEREIETIITLESPTGEEIVVTTTGKEIVDYCEAQVEGDGYRVQVRSPDFGTSIEFKPSKYRL